MVVLLLLGRRHGLLHERLLLHVGWHRLLWERLLLLRQRPRLLG